MSDLAAALLKMAEYGLTMEQAAEIARLLAPGPSKGAERQARYRARKAASVTSDVTRDVTSDVTEASHVTPLAHVENIPLRLVTTGKKISSEPKGSSQRACAIAKPNGFARFWEAYPEKVGKRAAEQAYAKALTRIEGPDPPAVIMAGLARARWREGYIPHPTTWLNQDRWEDEPAPRNESPDGRRPHPATDAKFAAKQANLARAFANS